MVVELDPEGLVPLKSGSRLRYPETGSTPLNMVQPPPFRHIIVPTINSATGNESIVSWGETMALDHPYMNLLRSLLPVAHTELEIHEPYRTNTSTFGDWIQWLNDMVSLMEREGRRGYYYGASAQSAGGLLGVAYLGVAASVGINRADVHTHEVGHNMSLPPRAVRGLRRSQLPLFGRGNRESGDMTCSRDGSSPLVISRTS